MVESFCRVRTRKQEHPRPFITIAREYGCDAYELAAGLCERINEVYRADPPWSVYDKRLVERVAEDMQITSQMVRSMTTEHRTAFEQFLDSMVLNIPSTDVIYHRVARVIRGVAWHGNAVIIGRGGVFLSRDLAPGFHIGLVAPPAWRLQRLVAKGSFPNGKEGEHRLEAIDGERQRFYRKYFEVEIDCARSFDLVINNATFSPPEMVELVMSALTARPGRLTVAA
jgi:cytidylate kinase